jgi:hypothetical protein
MSRNDTDRWLARLDPDHRIDELTVENMRLRVQRDREIRGRLFAEEMLAHGIRPPHGVRFDGRGEIIE